jgi:hypothetical protein
MSGFTRSVNRTLRKRLGVEVVPARTPSVSLHDEWFARLLHFNGLIESISGVNGDIVECGVADGSSLAAFASLLKANRQDRRVWGFDSWAGLPAPSQADLGDASIATGGMFSYSSTKRVRDELFAYGITEEEIARKVTLVPGLFSETLPRYDGRVALLHIDADLYQSYLDCLENLWPRVEVGGVVAFDEYGEPEAWPGAQRAVDEFFATRSGQVSELHHDEPSGKWWLSRTA